jgi:hypothetical protein
MPEDIRLDSDVFRRGLLELDYVEGKNIALEVPRRKGNNRRPPAIAAELAALTPDVIVTEGSAALQQTNRSIAALTAVSLVKNSQIFSLASASTIGFSPP